MGRQAKSLAELELSGALKARPGRYKQRLETAKASATVGQNTIIAPEPAKPAPLGSAPKCLGPDEKAIWKELSKTYPNLTQSDRFHLEIAVKLLHKMRTAADGLKGQESSQLLGILDKFAPKDNPAPITPIKSDSSDPAPVIVDTRTPQEIAEDEAFAEWDAQDEEDREIRKEMQVTGKTYYQIQQEREARTRNE